MGGVWCGGGWGVLLWPPVLRGFGAGGVCCFGVRLQRLHRTWGGLVIRGPPRLRVVPGWSVVRVEVGWCIPLYPGVFPCMARWLLTARLRRCLAAHVGWVGGVTPRLFLRCRRGTTPGGVGVQGPRA